MKLGREHLEEFEEGMGDEPDPIFGYDYDEAGMAVVPSWVENISVYCYEGSDMDGYITSLSYDEIDVNVIYLDNTAIGEGDNVIVTGKADNAIEPGTMLVVTDVEADELGKDVKDKLGDMKYTILDISLVKDGAVVQPNGEVLVSIDVPEGFDGTKCKVYHIAEDGTFTDMKATYADGKLTFTTDHFSNCAVVEGTVSNEKAPTTPQTGDMADARIWGMWMAVACGVLLVLSGKKKYVK